MCWGSEGTQAWVGRGWAGSPGSAAAARGAPEESGGKDSGQEGATGAGAGGWMSGFFWQRAAGKLAGPVPGSSELRVVPPFHEQ